MLQTSSRSSKLGKIITLVLTAISFFSIVYLVMVVSGAYSVILSILIRYVKLPKELFISLQHHLSLFLAMSMTYIFLSRPARKGRGISTLDMILAVLAFVGPFYRFCSYHELVVRMGTTTASDIVFGIMTIITILEVVRRTAGIALFVIVAAFTMYALWDVGYNIKTFIERMYLYDVGIFSTPLSIAVTWISIFLFFGYFLDELGISEFFIKLSLATVGNKRGGPAKAAVIGGGLIGTTTGSAVGSSVLLSTFLVPAMKKFGYSAEESAALMAATGTGAQIMPPILGSAAFIMPLYLGVSYWTIVTASLVPAILYFIILFVITDLIAIKRGLIGLSRHDLPSLRSVLKEAYLAIPLGTIVYLLAEGYDPQLAALASLIIALILAGFRTGRITAMVSVGLAGITFLVPMMIFDLPYYSALFLSAGLLLPACLVMGLTKWGKELGVKVFRAINRAMKDSASMVAICAGAGLIAGSISLTGLAYTFGRIIFTIAGGNALIVYLITMIICIILGCAVPTPVVYVMTVSILGPLAYLLNVPPIALHYFIFYFGIFAPLTPPVALAVMASASVAGADYVKSAIIASLMTISAWVIGWGIVLRPEMLIVTVNHWDLSNLSMLITSVVAIIVAGLSLTIVYTGMFYGLKKTTIFHKVLYIALLLFSLYAVYVGSPIIIIIVSVTFILSILIGRFLSR